RGPYWRTSSTATSTSRSPTGPSSCSTIPNSAPSTRRTGADCGAPNGASSTGGRGWSGRRCRAPRRPPRACASRPRSQWSSTAPGPPGTTRPRRDGTPSSRAPRCSRPGPRAESRHSDQRRHRAARVAGDLPPYTAVTPALDRNTYPRRDGGGAVQKKVGGDHEGGEPRKCGPQPELAHPGRAVEIGGDAAVPGDVQSAAQRGGVGELRPAVGRQERRGQ